MDGRVGLWRKLSTKELMLWTEVLEKTLESHLDCREIQPVHSEGDEPWDFLGRNDSKAETPVLWPTHVKSWLIGKDSDAGRDWRQEEKGTTEDEMAGWHHWLDGCEFVWTPGVGDGQRGLVCCNSWGCKELDTTEWLNWTELNWNLLISGFPDGPVGKESTCNAGDHGWVPGSGRSAKEGIGYPLQYSWTSLVAQLVKNPPAMQETLVGSLGWEDPWRRERLPTPVGSQRVGHDWVTFTFSMWSMFD